MKIVIIEDEKLTAKDLAHTIRTVDPEVNILATLGSVEEGLNFFRQEIEVDLIFSDIQLGDGLSFELFEQLDLRTPIVYCTAFDKYALEAFKTFGVDYILKPFSQETVAQALEKFSLLRAPAPTEPANYASLISALRQGLDAPPKKGFGYYSARGQDHPTQSGCYRPFLHRTRNGFCLYLRWKEAFPFGKAQ
jgi:DNA-binding LytR/AlgR family response regulator